MQAGVVSVVCAGVMLAAREAARRVWCASKRECTSDERYIRVQCAACSHRPGKETTGMLGDTSTERLAPFDGVDASTQLEGAACGMGRVGRREACAE